VLSVSPNRAVHRTFSAVEEITGSAAAEVRGGAPANGLDGTGVGIAVLDSGVMREHRHFANANGVSRVRRNVDMLKSLMPDGAMGYAPGSAAQQQYEALVASDTSVFQDPYGHGTHVASIAAGGGQYEAPDATGVAPNADIYDVRVLGADGTGAMSDVIEGIEWVIYHARQYNIRVMNVSLSADSSESWRTDPLCLAVRKATASGIVVVVSAGNFGKSADGRVVHGGIGAPPTWLYTSITSWMANHIGSFAGMTYLSGTLDEKPKDGGDR